jgi:tocopherol O-methyltransferase
VAANTQKVKEHYDAVSPFYQKLWGNHIHHGYWRTGSESRDEATENLIKFLVEKAALKPRTAVLDIGFGVGGTSRWLAEHLQCAVTGITISPVQVELADSLVTDVKPRPSFLVMDAQQLAFDQEFDALFAIEVISHLEQREEFFRRAAGVMNPGAVFCITDWFKDAGLSAERQRKYIAPIEDGMIVSLPTLDEYLDCFRSNGLTLLYYEDLSAKVAKTWDLCLDIIKNKSFWKLALQRGSDFVKFLRAFKAMRDGYASGTLRYGAFVVKRL